MAKHLVDRSAAGLGKSLVAERAGVEAMFDRGFMHSSVHIVGGSSGNTVSSRQSPDLRAEARDSPLQREFFRAAE